LVKRITVPRRKGSEARKGKSRKKEGREGGLATISVGHIFGRPFVKRFALCYRTVALSVCLSVCLSVLSCPVCDVGVLWPNGWMDKNETNWHGRRPRPRPHCVRWGPSSPRKRHSDPPLFGRCLL